VDRSSLCVHLSTFFSFYFFFQLQHPDKP
jgi:hypothetical protein